MTTYQLIRLSPLERITNPRSIPEVAHLLARITRPTKPPTPERYGYAIVVPKPIGGTAEQVAAGTADYDTATHHLVDALTATHDQWTVTLKPAPPAPSPEELLAKARAEMAAVILALPPASRAKFSTAWAGGNTLLDVGDVEGCHALVNAIATDTPEEGTAKQTILDALTQFLP